MPEGHRQVAVITDSVAMVSQSLAQQLGISVVPVSLEFEGTTYQDGVDLEPAEVYRRMEASEQAPRTSQPTPGEWLEAFKLAARGGAGHILCFTVSSKLSGTHMSASVAARVFTEDWPSTTPSVAVQVIDTRLGAISQGWVVIEAARVAQAGAGVEKVLRRAEAVQARARMVAGLDTLEHLARGGHVPGLVSEVGDMLGLKVLIGFRNGSVVPTGFARSWERAFEAMVERMGEDVQRDGPLGDPMSLRVGVMHAGVPDRARSLFELTEVRLHPAELLLADLTPVMGAHTGPGLCGVGYFVDGGKV